jgi:hypothetical protein
MSHNNQRHTWKDQLRVDRIVSRNRAEKAEIATVTLILTQPQLPELDPDECRCCLPEQTCAACSQPATSDVELPY